MDTQRECLLSLRHLELIWFNENESNSAAFAVNGERRVLGTVSAMV